jgi:hypothetical protein
MRVSHAWSLEAALRALAIQLRGVGGPFTGPPSWLV